MSFFSFAFLGSAVILVGLYFLLPKKCQWVILLAASILFYLTSGWRGMVYITITIVTQYLLALALERKNTQMAQRLAEGLSEVSAGKLSETPAEAPCEAPAEELCEAPAEEPCEAPAEELSEAPVVDDDVVDDDVVDDDVVDDDVVDEDDYDEDDYDEDDYDEDDFDEGVFGDIDFEGMDFEGVDFGGVDYNGNVIGGNVMDGTVTDSESQAVETETPAEAKKRIKQCFAAKKKRYVLLSVLINLGILCFFKFANLSIGSVNQIFGLQVQQLDLLVPLGISYYTFKSIGYVIDVYRDRIKAQRNILKLALYISYFPALVQGPIDRYEDLAEQLYAEHAFSYQRLAFGAQRMLWGYVKKLVIAERIAVVVNKVLGSYQTEGYEGFIIFAAMALYAFQLYADFSGGMDIALGLSEIFGISLTENFRRPFFAVSYAEYWQRWHITLGAWMKTYVFYPVSLSPAFNKLGKKCRTIFGNKYGKLAAPSLASFITFFLIGMWHGAGWKYVLYSLYQAFFVSTGTLLADVYAKGRDVCKVNASSKSWRIFQSLRTFFLLSIARYFVLAKDVPDIVGLFKATFARFNPWVFFDGSFYKLGLNRPNFHLMLFSIVLLLAVDYMQEQGIRIRQTIARRNIVLRWCIYYAAFFALVILGMYGPGYNAASFIYQGF